MTEELSPIAKASRSIPVAANVLAMSSMLSVKKGLFGSLKPSSEQIGWSYGFCDAWAQAIPLTDDEEFIYFISTIFERVFGRSGMKHFMAVAKNQHEYLDSMIDGGNAHNSSVRDGNPPLMPLAR